MCSSAPIEVWIGADGIVREDVTDAVVTCSWFARCVRPANAVEAHPILGGVPICNTCLGAIHAD